MEATISGLTVEQFLSPKLAVVPVHLERGTVYVRELVGDELVALTTLEQPKDGDEAAHLQYMADVAFLAMADESGAPFFDQEQGKSGTIAALRRIPLRELGKIGEAAALLNFGADETDAEGNGES